MQNNNYALGQTVGIHKELVGHHDLTIYGEISGIRKHWNGNPDQIEIQVGGLSEWISLDSQVQILPYNERERDENECDC
jgi:hypothetical protein